MNIAQRKIFLIDGIGAVTSLFMLGLVLVHFEQYIGMPINVLYFLALGAGIFALYSMYCYLRLPSQWWIFLNLIAVVNLLYCLVTLGLVIYYYSQLTVLGLIYFFGEILIIFVLIGIEFKTAYKKSEN